MYVCLSLSLGLSLCMRIQYQDWFSSIRIRGFERAWMVVVMGRPLRQDTLPERPCGTTAWHVYARAQLGVNRTLAYQSRPEFGLLGKERVRLETGQSCSRYTGIWAVERVDGPTSRPLQSIASVDLEEPPDAVCRYSHARDVRTPLGRHCQRERERLNLIAG